MPGYVVDVPNDNAVALIVTKVAAGMNLTISDLTLDGPLAAEMTLDINNCWGFCYSDGFYFALRQSPIRTAETDADGKFVIELPKAGAFVIAAQAKRSVGDDTEHYYWLQPVSLQGQQQLTQNLSNNNLKSTTGTSSLIHTKD